MQHRLNTCSLPFSARLWLVGVVAVVAGGCAPLSGPVYEASVEVQELPERHQQNIADALRRIFGTPDFPRLMVPPETEDGDDEDPSEEQLVAAINPGHLRHGAQVYQARCSGCHGVTGNGQGDAAPYLRPEPRDYRRGIFKFTSTPYGAKPARHDLVRVIRRGAKGTSMPAFPWMPEEDLEAVIDYVILLSQRGEVELLLAGLADNDYDEDEDIDFLDVVDTLWEVRDGWELAESEVVRPVSAEPSYEEDSVRVGRELFISENCWKCHGKNAEGQTEWLSDEFLAEQESLPEDQRITINYDAWEQPAPAANITARMLHGGRRPVDIYRRIYTGINGTPMPAFGQLYADDPDKIWHLVHYVRHIIEGGPPQVP